MKNSQKKIRTALFLAILFMIAVIVPNYLVNFATKNKTYNSIQEVPSNKVGLLLGTSKFLRNGEVNLYYSYRIEAAVQLFKSNKIRFILVSGDNSKRGYDEPTTIKNDLVDKGVPESSIYLDYAGLRTLDSVIRCREIFGQDSVTFISQQFHNERAIFIANHKKIYSVGFNARDVNIYYGFRTKIREILARDKMILDLILNKNSRFLGKRVEMK